MIIFDVKTKAGSVVSTIQVGEDEASFVSQVYDSTYLLSMQQMFGDELALVKRPETITINNKMK